MVEFLQTDTGGSVDTRPGPPPSEILALYGFGASYPVLHYMLNNVEAFSASLAFNFALVAMFPPAVIATASHFLIRPFVSGRVYYLVSLVASIGILGAYMRPVYHQLSLLISLNSGIDLGKALIQLPIFLLLFGLGYRFRVAVAPFLSLVILLTAANVGYRAFSTGEERALSDHGSAIPQSLKLLRKPSVYILVVDAYQSRAGLIEKGLEHLDIGGALSSKGFKLYQNAWSNYKPTIPSLTSFLNASHHYYRRDPHWEDTMTGDNALFALLARNGYRTVIAHPNNFLLKGHCESDLCFPTLGWKGQVQFMLAETIYFREDFGQATAVGKKQYRDAMRELLGEHDAPTLLYSHVLEPNHGPRGCSDPVIPMQIYERGLGVANDWIAFAIAEIESHDEDAVILVLGDHGAFISDHCEWNKPDPTSKSAIVDNLGILMAVKWPRDYDGRYDGEIHSLIDLSWYLIQYLSDGAMNEDNKPASASYLAQRGSRRIFRVVEDGVVHTDSKAHRRRDLRAAELVLRRDQKDENLLP